MSTSRSVRPTRIAAKKAMENIQAIYAEYYNDEEDDNMSIDHDEDYFTTTYSRIAKKTPAIVIAPTLTRITDYKAAPEYDACEISNAINTTAHVQKIKTYLIAADEKKDNHINIPELMKFFILNPYMMIKHAKFNNTVTNKMAEFVTVMKDQKTLNGQSISDQYRKEFTALAKIVNTNAKINSIINLTQPFYNDIDKIATEYEKAINSFVAAINPTAN